MHSPANDSTTHFHRLIDQLIAYKSTYNSHWLSFIHIAKYATNTITFIDKQEGWWQNALYVCRTGKPQHTKWPSDIDNPCWTCQPHYPSQWLRLMDNPWSTILLFLRACSILILQNIIYYISYILWLVFGGIVAIHLHHWIQAVLKAFFYYKDRPYYFVHHLTFLYSFSAKNRIFPLAGWTLTIVHQPSTSFMQ